MLVTFREVGQAGELGTVVVNPKNFKTGSTGWFGVDKLVIAGKRCQVLIQVVEIGSKAANATPSTPVKKEKKA